MARFKYNLVDLDINKLFEDHKIEEIVEIERLLEAEIERKRSELRSMVGDRYKDILTASDSIKSMKNMSEKIVESIQSVTAACEKLIGGASPFEGKMPIAIDKQKSEERTLIIQIRLAILINEQIWICLDQKNNLSAAQLLLLAQTIQIGLSLTNSNCTETIPLLKQIKSGLLVLQNKIINRITEELESVALTAEQTCSNLNGLMLLQNQSTQELLSIFIDHRKTALNTVINGVHSSVRVQISAMVQCLMTTIHLLYECFIRSNNSQSGLIWSQLEDIVKVTSPTTLSKLNLPVTPLTSYIPDIIKNFRPKCAFQPETMHKNADTLINVWLQVTKETIKFGLQNSLDLITSIKGLHIIKEEALKISEPSNWQDICRMTSLPTNFSIWYYFFQGLITNRARALISKKTKSCTENLQDNLDNLLKTIGNTEVKEIDLRSYVWSEDAGDVSRAKNTHTGLAMKTMGFTQNISNLCKKLDVQYLELLNDLSLYLYGVEFDSSTIMVPLVIKDYKFKRKYVDVDELEKNLIQECSKSFLGLLNYLENILTNEVEEMLILKSLVCIRFLQSVTKLCPYFKKCCSFNGAMEDWHKICDNVDKTGINFWQYWIESSICNTQRVSSELLKNLELVSMVSILPRWDMIEIQEQTDDKVFTSQIKVPLKPSLALENILFGLNENLCCILPHTLPKDIHVKYIESNVEVILNRYKILLLDELNQNQALQFLFDVRFLTTFCILRENTHLISVSQDICDKLRSKIDPFDLDVFYSYLQTNVRRAVVQTQVILGCLLPSSNQLANIGIPEKSRDQEKEPSILAVTIPSTATWFSLLPVTVPSQKNLATELYSQNENKVSISKDVKTIPKKLPDSSTPIRTGAAALFGGLTTDWFS